MCARLLPHLSAEEKGVLLGVGSCVALLGSDLDCGHLFSIPVSCYSTREGFLKGV